MSAFEALADRALAAFPVVEVARPNDVDDQPDEITHVSASYLIRQ
jgi:hypothetical protein